MRGQLVRKIEVAKRVWRRYGADWRPVERIEVDMDSYALISYFLALGLRGQDHLQILNALLKLNDMLSHGRDEVTSSIGASCVYQAVDIERRIVDSTMTERIQGPSA